MTPATPAARSTLRHMENNYHLLARDPPLAIKRLKDSLPSADPDLAAVFHHVIARLQADDAIAQRAIADRKAEHAAIGAPLNTFYADAQRLRMEAEEAEKYGLHLARPKQVLRAAPIIAPPIRMRRVRASAMREQACAFPPALRRQTCLFAEGA